MNCAHDSIKNDLIPEIQSRRTASFASCIQNQPGVVTLNCSYGGRLGVTNGNRSEKLFGFMSRNIDGRVWELFYG